jgi:hypothetical protein
MKQEIAQGEVQVFNAGGVLPNCPRETSLTGFWNWLG